MLDNKRKRIILNTFQLQKLFTKTYNHTELILVKALVIDNVHIFKILSIKQKRNSSCHVAHRDRWHLTKKLLAYSIPYSMRKETY